MELDFNQCVGLLIIGFIMGLVLVRCLLAVVNRGFLLVDYAQEKLYPGGKKGGGGFGMKDLVGGVFQSIMPAIAQKAQEFLGVKPK